MVENHTRDLLQMKAKETQLARSRNDAELTQAALSKAQRDLEALRQSSQQDSSKDLENWKSRAEKAEQRLIEREDLDQKVLSRLGDLEEFVKGLDDNVPDADSVSRISSRCKEVEDQNRRLLSQLEEYASRINTLEEVFLPPTLLISGIEKTNYISPKKWEFVFL
jgi:vacuolar-type H+-ATPase subunit D/Vma8